ncbi:hypothetical protein [Brachybacterium endophyticum]|nr:hypothetical protein [Brachybacterium endophyticum]
MTLSFVDPRGIRRWFQPSSGRVADPVVGSAADFVADPAAGSVTAAMR